MATMVSQYYVTQYNPMLYNPMIKLNFNRKVLLKVWQQTIYQIESSSFLPAGISAAQFFLSNAEADRTSAREDLKVKLTLSEQEATSRYRLSKFQRWEMFQDSMMKSLGRIEKINEDDSTNRMQQYNMVMKSMERLEQMLKVHSENRGAWKWDILGSMAVGAVLGGGMVGIAVALMAKK